MNFPTEEITVLLSFFNQYYLIAIVSIVLVGITTTAYVIRGGSVKVPIAMMIVIVTILIAGCRREPQVGDVHYELCATSEPPTWSSVTLRYRSENERQMGYLLEADSTNGEPRWCGKLLDLFEFGAMQVRITVVGDEITNLVIRRSKLLEDGTYERKEVPLQITNDGTFVNILETEGPVIQF